jgi:hypothetical protein
MELSPYFWEMVDHLWWFCLGGLGVIVLIVAIVYCNDWDGPGDPPAPQG